MAIILQHIDEYTAQVRKKDTLYMVFNPSFVRLSLGLPSKPDEPRWSKQSQVATDERDMFLQFVKAHMPHVTLTEVFDSVPAQYLTIPYLGTLALDIDTNSWEQKKIQEHYEDSKGNPKTLSAVLFLMPLQQALEADEERQLFINQNERET